MTRQYPLPLPHEEAMEADDFMVTNSNREALAWINKWPDWQAHCLVIFGPSGSGKSHLANVFRARSQGNFIKADQLSEMELGSEVKKNKIVLIDNADAVTENPLKEVALFHLYNLLQEEKGFLLLTSVTAPAQWNIKLADLRSRLLSVPAVALGAPDDMLLSVLLIKQFRDRQIDIGLDVIDYLLPRITRTPGAIRSIVTALDRTSLAEGRGITVALARRLMADQPFLIS